MLYLTVILHLYSYSITYYECVFLAVVTLHSRGMSLIVLPSVACQDLPHFFALSHIWYDFRKKSY